MEIASALSAGGFVSPNTLVPVNKANLTLPDSSINENFCARDIYSTSNRCRTDTKHAISPTGANFRSLKTDFRSQMHETDALKPVFHREKKAKATTTKTQTNRIKQKQNK